MENIKDFEKRATDLVYNTDNYNTYFEAFKLHFTDFGDYKDKDSKVSVIETLEAHEKNELVRFYTELYEMVGIDDYNPYEPTLESLLKFDDGKIHVFSILKLIFAKESKCEFKFGFVEFFNDCFNWDDKSFETSRLKENTGYETEVGEFFNKWEHLLDGLKFEDSLKELVTEIVAKVEHSMEMEYTETLYNLEQGNDEDN